MPGPYRPRVQRRNRILRDLLQGHNVGTGEWFQDVRHWNSLPNDLRMGRHPWRTRRHILHDVPRDIDVGRRLRINLSNVGHFAPWEDPPRPARQVRRVRGR